ncbi:MAG TPA: hypothetical protein ENN40_01820 [Candidatus Aminicenantes bacterium]|nr:hypothetical protein [Candidatus Aminicenantes bacterium]
MSPWRDNIEPGLPLCYIQKMMGISGKSRLTFVLFVLGLLFLAGMLALTGYLLRVRAIHHGHLDGLKQELNLAHSRTREPARARKQRADFYINRFLFTFPNRQARAAEGFVSLIQQAAVKTSVREWSLQAAGMGLRFNIAAAEAAEPGLIRALLSSAEVLRLDSCAPPATCLRGLVGVF